MISSGELLKPFTVREKNRLRALSSYFLRYSSLALLFFAKLDPEMLGKLSGYDVSAASELAANGNYKLFSQKCRPPS